MAHKFLSTFYINAMLWTIDALPHQVVDDIGVGAHIHAHHIGYAIGYLFEQSHMVHIQ